MRHLPLPLYWHVDMLMGSVGNPKVREFGSSGSCQTDEELESGSLVVVDVLVTSLCKTVPHFDQDTMAGFQEADKLRR